MHIVTWRMGVGYLTGTGFKSGLLFAHELHVQRLGWVQRQAAL